MLVVFSVVGFLLSCYALYVSFRSKDKSYTAFCDFSENVSCSKVFGHKYGSLFGAKNSYFGMFFYLLIVLSYYLFSDALVYLVSFGLVVTFVLAYLLWFRVKNFCLVCSLIYVVNVVLFFIVV